MFVLFFPSHFLTGFLTKQSTVVYFNLTGRAIYKLQESPAAVLLYFSRTQPWLAEKSSIQFDVFHTHTYINIRIYIYIVLYVLYYTIYNIIIYIYIYIYIYIILYIILHYIYTYDHASRDARFWGNSSMAVEETRISEAWVLRTGCFSMDYRLVVWNMTG